MVIRCQICKRKINLVVDQQGQLGPQITEHLAKFHHVALQHTLTIGGAASLLLQFDRFADVDGNQLAEQRDALFEELCDALGIDLADDGDAPEGGAPDPDDADPPAPAPAPE